MRSLIILEVSHGEDTDRLQSMLNHVLHEYGEGMAMVYPGRPVVKDYTVKVDIPECFVLDSRNDGQGTCQAHPDIHAFAHNCVGFRDSI